MLIFNAWLGWSARRFFRRGFLLVKEPVLAAKAQFAVRILLLRQRYSRLRLSSGLDASSSER